VQITFTPPFRYAGGQRFLLYGVAEAEQHFYVQSNASGHVECFYTGCSLNTIFPTIPISMTIHPKRTTDIGGLNSIYDTAVVNAMEQTLGLL
jgi:hypothetical protein